MGEIKSTLDLVMERTRHLSMSADEKARQRRTDFSRRLQGVLQQYADGALTTAQLQSRVSDLQAELGMSGRETLLAAVIERIDPDADVRCWLDLLAELAPPVHAALENMLHEYRTARSAIQHDAERLQLDHLARAHGIHGSAVLPNPLKDAGLQERLGVMREQLRSKITAFGETAG